MVKTFKNFSSRTEDTLGLNLCLNHRGQGSTKVAKIMVVQVCFPMHLYGKKHLKILFSKTEDALWLNLCIYYWEHLHVCSGYVTQVSEPWLVGLLFHCYKYVNILSFLRRVSVFFLQISLVLSVLVSKKIAG